MPEGEAGAAAAAQHRLRRGPRVRRAGRARRQGRQGRAGATDLSKPGPGQGSCHRQSPARPGRRRTPAHPSPPAAPASVAAWPAGGRHLQRRRRAPRGGRAMFSRGAGLVSSALRPRPSSRRPAGSVGPNAGETACLGPGGRTPV
eukprot:894848-Lingulodinium_polyedra.AAC.1